MPQPRESDAIAIIDVQGFPESDAHIDLCGGGTLRNHILGLGLLACMAITSAGCDPGVRYRPRDWTRLDADHWRSTVEGISLTMEPIGGLIGETWLEPEIEAQNHTGLTAIIEDAKLLCGQTSYEADSVGLSGTRSQISSGETKRLNLRWNFSKSIGEVLVAPVTMTITLRVGGATKAVAIPMSRFSYK